LLSRLVDLVVTPIRVSKDAPALTLDGDRSLNECGDGVERANRSPGGTLAIPGIALDCPRLGVVSASGIGVAPTHLVDTEMTATPAPSAS
jgi:hypothetical protein